MVISPTCSAPWLLSKSETHIPPFPASPLHFGRGAKKFPLCMTKLLCVVISRLELRWRGKSVSTLAWRRNVRRMYNKCSLPCALRYMAKVKPSPFFPFPAKGGIKASSWKFSISLRNIQAHRTFLGEGLATTVNRGTIFFSSLLPLPRSLSLAGLHFPPNHTTSTNFLCFLSKWNHEWFCQRWENVLAKKSNWRIRSYRGAEKSDQTKKNLLTRSQGDGAYLEIRASLDDLSEFPSFSPVLFARTWKLSFFWGW